MADSDFWRELAEKFRTLDPSACLRFQWVICPEDKSCEVNVVGTGDACRTIKTQFEALATRAGKKLDKGTDTLTGLARWLDEIRMTRPNERPYEGIRQRTDGTEVRLFGGTIMGVCVASADLCNVLEVAALESEQSESTPQVAPNAAANENTPPSVGAQVRSLREECRWTAEELASKMDLDERTVRRHETDEVNPYARTLRGYERVFSKQLDRKIVISKMP
jgi:DNA-binding XRE family transcriptional regulator